MHLSANQWLEILYLSIPSTSKAALLYYILTGTCQRCRSLDLSSRRYVFGGSCHMHALPTALTMGKQRPARRCRTLFADGHPPTESSESEPQRSAGRRTGLTLRTPTDPVRSTSRSMYLHCATVTAACLCNVVRKSLYKCMHEDQSTFCIGNCYVGDKTLKYSSTK